MPQRCESRQDIAACKRQLLALLAAYPNRPVTSGWCGDRGLTFTEYAISLALRKLVNDGKLVHIFDGGLHYYALLKDQSCPKTI